MYCGEFAFALSGPSEVEGPGNLADDVCGKDFSPSLLFNGLRQKKMKGFCLFLLHSFTYLFEYVWGVYNMVHVSCFYMGATFLMCTSVCLLVYVRTIPMPGQRGFLITWNWSYRGHCEPPCGC